MTPDQLAATRLASSYSVDVFNPAGHQFSGQTELERHGAFLHATTTFSNGQIRHGLALPIDNRLIMAFGPKDKVEIGAYRITAHEMAGLWIPPGSGRDDFAECGREISVGGENGIWTIRDAAAIDGSRYAGTVEVTPMDGSDPRVRPTPVRIAWILQDGNYESFGLLYNDAMFTAFTFEPEQPYGIAVYDVRDGELTGASLTSGTLKPAQETLRRLI